ncbi:MAG: magnesium transporter CorA family protein [Rhizobiaceae bacterium]|nr:MAG: magnesium transporter CorA family protein [Rhizobiaceae bacterium]
MIKAYRINGDVLKATELSPGAALPEGTVWIDMLAPDPEEDRRVEAAVGVSVPTREEMKDIEESSRLYGESGALYLTIPVVYAATTDTAGVEPVTFIVADRCLVTLRYTTPQPFASYAARSGKPGTNLITAGCDPMDILFGLLESITDRLAEHIENAAQTLNAESARLISGSAAAKPMSTEAFRSGLRLIGREGDFLAKIRESLAGVSRLLAYIQSTPKGQEARKRHGAWVKSLERDVQSLSDHVAFLSERTIFLMDTVVGLVSVEQNAIIKTFSVAAVVLMPPTLVASVYGMNFRHMPELDWVLGYPAALGLMVVSALLPLLYFKIRGWL